MVAAGAIGAAAGSVVSQGLGIAIGQQSSFNFGAVGLAALGGGISAGLANGIGGLTGAQSQIGQFAQAAARGALSNAITQGVGVATGLQSSFDWAGVAAAGIGAGVGDAAGQTSFASNFGQFGDQAVSGVAGAIAGAATRSVLTGTDFGDNIIATLPSAIANTIGNLVAGGIAQSNNPAPSAAAGFSEAANLAAINTAGINSVNFPSSPIGPIPAYLAPPAGTAGGAIPTINPPSAFNPGGQSWNFLIKPSGPFDAPTYLSFNQSINGTWNKLENETAVSGNEQGAEFITEASDPYGLSKLDEVTGTKTSVQLGTTQAPLGTEITLDFHTHPTNAAFGGLAFDFGDVVSLIDEPTVNISVVQSGNDQFLLMKTAQTPNIYLDANSSTYKAMTSKYTQDQNNYMTQGLSYGEAVFNTTMDLAQKYNLSFYQGSNGHFVRQWPQ